MAACDADYRFTFIDVGSPGADGDVNVFARTEFGKNILENNDCLNLPSDLPIDDEDTTLFFIADEAFPLSNRIIKPFGGKSLTNKQKVFNYRLSRARRTIENAFGILSMRWGCLRSEFICHPDKVKLMVAACCCLHNFLMNRSSIYYQKNSENVEVELNRNELRDISLQMDQINVHNRGRPNDSGSIIRERLSNCFFNNDVLPFQFDRAHCNQYENEQ